MPPMRLPIVQKIAKNLPEQECLQDFFAGMEWVKWNLCHGNLVRDMDLLYFI